MAEPTRPEDALPIGSFDDLLAPLLGSMRPRGEFVVGAEMERFGVLVEDGAPIPYEGDRGVRRVLEELVAGGGWRAAEPERAGGPLIALTRADEIRNPPPPRGRHPRDVRILPKSRDFH